MPSIGPSMLSQDELVDILSTLEPVHAIPHKNRYVYSFCGLDQQLLMKELGRIREFNYRHVHAGSQKPYDIDALDMNETRACRQLILWDNDIKKIIAGARIFSTPLLRKNMNRPAKLDELSTSLFIKTNHTFEEHCLQNLIEITRVFISIPQKQADGHGPSAEQDTKLSHDFYKLDQLYAAIGKIISKEKILYILGRVVINTTSVPLEMRKVIQSFFHTCFASYTIGHSKEDSFKPAWLRGEDKLQNIEKLSGFSKKNSYEENTAIFLQKSKDLNTPIPALVRNYIIFSQKLHYFGYFEDYSLSNIEEIALMSACQDLEANRQKRYYSNEFKEELKQLPKSIDRQ